MKAEKQEPGVLSGILAEAPDRVLSLREHRARLERAAADAPAAPPFAAALHGGQVALIAEVKRRSPSAGAIREGADAASLAREYLAAGAAAISVLTEPNHFGGSLEDLERVAALGVPALRKDFLVHELQITEARAAGASAALLIMRAVGPWRLGQLLKHAAATGIEILVEVHDVRELSAAVDAGAKLIGVNARDLETLHVDPAAFEKLLPRIPEGITRVAESGMSTRADVERAAAAGAHAVLVGTALAGAAQPGEVLRELLGVTR